MYVRRGENTVYIWFGTICSTPSTAGGLGTYLPWIREDDCTRLYDDLCFRAGSLKGTQIITPTPSPNSVFEWVIQSYSESSSEC